MLGEELLRGEKVYLSAWRKDDVPIVTRWFQNPEFMRLLDAEPSTPKTDQYVEDWLDQAAKSSQEHSFPVRLVKDDSLIGLVELEGIEWSQGFGTLGIGIGDPAYWGGGYGREAVALLVRFGFWELNLHRIQLTVFSYNQRAIAAYENLGFVREGTMREVIARDGQRYDMHMYGLLRREWEAGNSTP